ncbi:LuxR C-terminal-related transcriptional regulator [Streptomyces sp. NPDC013157]|uniref:LuxR C-terminal-related transcriptional regulator n=1 Tax=Streptomyces sp. NPDC013157 TaxID=3364861 RepID=UPI0036BFE142
MRSAPPFASPACNCTVLLRGAPGRSGACHEQALAAGAALDDAGQAIAHALGTGTGSATAQAAAPAAASGLTRREEQVAAPVARGMTHRRIAAELVLSSRTVDNHVNRILTELGLSSRVQPTIALLRDFLPAAGVIRLAAEPSWTSPAIAAATVAVRMLVNAGLRTGVAPAG